MLQRLATKERETVPDKVSVIWNSLRSLNNRLTILFPKLEAAPVSVMVDGSLIRGDFLPNASDVDLTITFGSDLAGPPVCSALEAILAEIDQVCADLPVREWPAKPLQFDVHLQTVADVDCTRERELLDWNIEDIPPGYPKLWLYAFDVVRHHLVLFGHDVTVDFCKLPPKTFVPLRMKQIHSEAVIAGAGPTEYDRQHKTISQAMYAWEAIRALQIHYGGDSIKKDEVIRNWNALVPNFSGKF